MGINILNIEFFWGDGLIKKSNSSKIFNGEFTSPSRDVKSSFSWVRTTHRISRITSLIIIILAALIILGWVLNIPVMMGTILGSPPTKFNTALGFLVMGIALYLLNIRGDESQVRSIGRVCGVFIVILGTVTFLQYLFNFSLPSDQLFSLLFPNSSFNSRIRFLSSLNFIIFGLALYLFSTRKFISFAQIICFIAGIIGYMGFVTYLFGLGSLEQSSVFYLMAFYTSILHILAATSFLTLCPLEGIVSIIQRDSSGGYMARQLMPLSAFCLTLVAFLSVLGEKNNLYHSNYGEIILVSAVMAFLFMIIVLVAQKLNKLDMEQKKSSERIISMEKFFENILEGIVDGIMVFDKNDSIMYLNRGMANMFLENEDNIRNLPLQNAFISKFLPELSNYYQEASQKMKPIKIEFMPLYRNHETRYISGWIIPQIKHNDFNGAIFSAADITIIKEAENVLESSLREKELLLGEIHHRVKNNLQIISSLLSLQSDDLTGEMAKDVLLESQNRIKTMSLVHESLYRSENFSQIDMRIYIEKLARGLASTYQSSNKASVQMVFDCENIKLAIDTAIPLGLILNELITNSLKHAFKGRTKGEIRITFKQKDDEYLLIVEDDGVGLDKEIDFKSGSTLGIKLLDGLVRQLDGKIRIDNKNGVKTSITFHQMDYVPRL